MRRITLLITPGDPDGVGPELTWKAVQRFRLKHPEVRLICVGARRPFDELGISVREIPNPASADETNGDSALALISAPTDLPRSSEKAAKLRRTSLLEGFQAGWSIVAATRLIQAGQADALVTGPISKERLQAGGYPYPGHTEFLADLCRSRSVTMMLANSQLRVSLVTTHLALKDVPKKLSRDAIRRAILNTADFLNRDYGIKNPKIAVSALNPHGGEGGLFGNEEIRTIIPEIRSLQSKRDDFALFGPFPADTLFAKHLDAPPDLRYDAVICMYHDQGLIPVKLLDFQNTVNISLGLPIVRTSVDHGVGFDIARTGKADPSSLLAAIDLAHRIVQNRPDRNPLKARSKRKTP